MALFSSSTKNIPESNKIPRHIAVIMDGNGRWARKRFLPRIAGHKKGVDTVRTLVKACDELGVEHLTLFAFSSENWRRPADEVSFLMSLFIEVLKKEVEKLNKNNIRLRFIGDQSKFAQELRDAIYQAETMTEQNQGLTLTIAANYGGRWDIVNAVNHLAKAQPEKIGKYTEEDLAPYLSMHYAPEPDLFIRTGGEERISNFLLWQLAYTELYFTETLWPDFNAQAFALAIESYQQRERRFGQTSEQIATK